jgi:DNA polymerase-3 subunit epsilon
MKTNSTTREAVSVDMNSTWLEADLVALDLEGSGAQDREDEAILEVATVPIIAGRPSIEEAYCSLVNPQRSIPNLPWISPGLTDAVLRDAPSIEKIQPDLAKRIDGRIIVGHNVNVDWRLLHRRCPDIAPAGLLDTLRLARGLLDNTSRGLTNLLAVLGLTSQVEASAAGSQPHRAMWDAVGVAYLLAVLVELRWTVTPRVAELLQEAGVPLSSGAFAPPIAQPGLFEI